MSEEIYRKLARRLDAIPNGFPATESGVELRLLAKLFTPAEAALAAVMRLTHEPAADIAARAGMDPKTARGRLKDMARKGLIRTGRGEGQLAFGLLPFVVGIYEEQLPRLDAELATLFEQYVQETRGGLASDLPPVHRVIPVDEAIPFDLEIFPYERANELVENARSWAVRDCICRVQQRLVGKGCDHPVENCLVFAPVENAFKDDGVNRPISKAEAQRILREAEAAGLVHSTGNFQNQNYYICNCCTCCCGVLRGVAEFNIPTAIAHSDFRAVVNAEACIGCESCVERCQFGALAVPYGISVVDYARCVGCGQCVTACDSGALSLQRRPAGEVLSPPADIQAWMVQRAQARGVSLEDVL